MEKDGPALGSSGLMGQALFLLKSFEGAKKAREGGMMWGKLDLGSAYQGCVLCFPAIKCAYCVCACVRGTCAAQGSKTSPGDIGQCQETSSVVTSRGATGL